MDRRAELLKAWLEGEGARRRPVPLSPEAGHPAVRGWVHVRVCVWGGALVAGLFVCWLAGASNRAARTGALEELRSMHLQEATGGREGLKAGPRAPPDRGR